ncbi:MAG: 2,3-bisphosphoglycerate-independent phosphoglycerate mutase [Bacillota bacterium]
MKNFLVLIIMDGWGIREERGGNAIAQAHTPVIDALMQKYPWARLAANGEDVGLPAGVMGNSEVGHLNLGAGRIVYQDLVRISKAITSGDFFKNEVLLRAMQEARRKNSALHLMGLLSDGGVHSHNTHLYALLRMAREQGVSRVYIHPILDGRDTPPQSAGRYLQDLEHECREIGTGAIASIAGRYYSMDRDKRWPRTEKAYRAYVYGEGEEAPDSLEALAQAYGRGETDEFVLPTLIKDSQGKPLALIRNADVLIFFNFRADRARQISHAFTDKEFMPFLRGGHPPLPYYVTFTEYEAGLAAPVVFQSMDLRDTLGEVISNCGLKQLRIAETEKYAHVTYFFSGGREEAFRGEERILIPSAQVPTYDLKPEMSAPEVTARVLQELDKGCYTLIVLNFANADMVGHTGMLPQAIKAVETVDCCVGKVVEKVLAKGGIALVTSDHGNAEMMLDDHTPHTAHTTNDTPLILVAPRQRYRLKAQGRLADVAPTVLKLLSLPSPAVMEGEDLLIS